MSFWTAAVIIIALLVLGDVMKSRHRGRRITTDATGQEQLSQRNEDRALKREVEELRERIKVLERIATEDRDTKQLSAEIERLREK